MMEDNIMTRLKAKIKRAPKSTIFLFSDFAPLGNPNTVRVNVKNLVDHDELQSIMPGIYMKPNYDEILQMNIPPSPESIARAYARKHNWRIAPTGNFAVNLMGLDTQVPNALEFVSSGPTKKLTLPDGRLVSFRHISNRDSLMSELSATVVEVLKFIGKNNISTEQLETIRRHLTDAEYRKLVRESKYSRKWVVEEIRKMGEMNV
jgi:hypothetical protein